MNHLIIEQEGTTYAIPEAWIARTMEAHDCTAMDAAQEWIEQEREEAR